MYYWIDPRPKRGFGLSRGVWNVMAGRQRGGGQLHWLCLQLQAMPCDLGFSQCPSRCSELSDSALATGWRTQHRNCRSAQREEMFKLYMRWWHYPYLPAEVLLCSQYTYSPDQEVSCDWISKPLEAYRHDLLPPAFRMSWWCHLLTLWLVHGMCFRNPDTRTQKHSFYYILYFMAVVLFRR